MIESKLLTGLGTSSILAGAIIAVLWTASGRQYDLSTLNHAVGQTSCHLRLTLSARLSLLYCLVYKKMQVSQFQCKIMLYGISMYTFSALYNYYVTKYVFL